MAPFASSLLACLLLSFFLACASLPLAINTKTPHDLQFHAKSTWNCTTLNESSIAADATWTQAECSGDTPLGKVGPLRFNIVRADLTKGSLALLPAVSNASPPLQTLTDISAENAHTIAAINGGYFWRVDDASFIDNVCWTKSKEQATQPPSEKHRSYGVGDSAVVINSTIIATNCEDPGYARPAALVCDGTNSNVIVQHRAELLPPSTSNAIAAGPNLVSSGSSGSYVDIPLDDFNVNIWEHASNTAVGLVGDASGAKSVVFAVADGHDKCPVKDVTCGITAHRMAYFMKDFIGVYQAMEMDQGGSSTMWVKGLGRVSNPGIGERAIYSALLLVQL